MASSRQRIAGHPRHSRGGLQVGLPTPSTAARRPRDWRSAVRSDVQHRREWVQALTTLIALGALVFTGVSVVQTGRQNAQQDNLAAQGQITDRYTSAINQIGSPTLDVRLGGIYALERIMHDSPADQPIIVEVLSAFIRDHPPGATKLPSGMMLVNGGLPVPTDVAAALTVLGRRAVADDGASVEDLNGVDLVGVNLNDLSLPDADLDGADLAYANLTGANLVGANLSGVNLDYANLYKADMHRVILADASFYDTSLRDVDLTGANLGSLYRGGNLADPNLPGAYLPATSVLSATDLASANLADTSLCSGSTPVRPNLGYRCK